MNRFSGLPLDEIINIKTDIEVLADDLIWWEWTYWLLGMKKDYRRVAAQVNSMETMYDEVKVAEFSTCKAALKALES